MIWLTNKIHVEAERAAINTMLANNESIAKELCDFNKRLKKIEGAQYYAECIENMCAGWNERYFKQQDELKEIIQEFNSFFIRLNQLDEKLNKLKEETK